MVYFRNKGSNMYIQRVALNSSGGVVNLTGAVISVTFKQFANSSTTLFTKTSASATEVLAIDAARGLFLVMLASTNTSSLNYKSLYCMQTVTVGGVVYSDVFYIRLKGVAQTADSVTASPIANVKTGTTAERTAYGLTLGTTDACVWIDTDQNTAYFWSTDEWV